MAVQAQNPSNALADLRHRAAQHSNMEGRSFLSPLAYGQSLLNDCQQSVPGAATLFTHPQHFQPVTAPVAGSSVPNFTLFQQPVVDITAHAVGARKRRKESNDRRACPQRKQQTTLPLVDLNQARGSSPVPPQSVVVSTGLRLAFDDERSTITSSRPDVGSTVLSTLREELSTQLSQQRGELDLFLTSQADQLRQALEERRQRHSKALLSAIDESVSRRLRESEVELERVNRRNMELEERVKLLSVESHMWQSKAKSNEAMVGVLRANLQQAVAQSREQSREGCGDSEADDAASAHVDENAEGKPRGLAMAMARREQQQGGEVVVRACRRCRAREASILLLPCLHLCLCNDCKGEVERCPLCHSLKSASVEVYLA